MDLTELNNAIAAYKAAPPRTVGAFNWQAIVTLLPALLAIFIPDPALRAVITQLVQVVLNLFFPVSGQQFSAAQQTHAATGTPNLTSTP